MNRAAGSHAPINAHLQLVPHGVHDVLRRLEDPLVHAAAHLTPRREAISSARSTKQASFCMRLDLLTACPSHSPLMRFTEGENSLCTGRHKRSVMRSACSIVPLVGVQSGGGASSEIEALLRIHHSGTTHDGPDANDDLAGSPV